MSTEQTTPPVNDQPAAAPATEGGSSGVPVDLMDVFDLSPTDDNSGDDQVGASGSDTPSVVAGADAGEGAQPSAPASSPAAGTPPASQDGTPAQPQNPAAPATTEGAPTPEMVIASLRAQIAQLQQAQPATQPAQPATEGQPAAQPAASEDQLQPVNFKMPDQLRKMLTEGEPEDMVAVVEQLIAGVANYAQQVSVRMAQAEAQKAVAAYKAEQTTAVQSQAQMEEARKMRDAYFSAFPQHNQPLYTSVLNQEAAKLAAELPGHPWDANFINALGARVNKVLADAGIGTAGQTPAAVNTNPPAMMGAGTRPAGASGAAPTTEDEIAELFTD